VTPAFILLVHKNGLEQARAGFTASRRIGGSVARNRARRRLKEMARLVGSQAVPGADHVFIARPREAELPFAALLADGERALRRARDKLGAMPS
jgi:ribonuclease P protein component